MAWSSGLQTNLISLHEFDTTNETNLGVPTVGTYNATNVNGVLYSKIKEGTACHVNGGLTSYLESTTAPSVSTNFSFSMWLRQTAGLSVTYSYISKTQTNKEFLVYSDTVGNLIFQLFLAGGQVAAVSQPIVRNATYHIVGTWDSSVGTKLYINNGTPAATAYTGSYNSGVSSTLQIGARNGGQVGNGWIGQVAFWNRTLSASDVAELYNSGTMLPYVDSPTDDQILEAAGGNYHDPENSEVLKDARVGVAPRVGTFDEAARNIDPLEENVKDGTAYKILNADKTGSLATGLLTPALSIDGNLLATISNSETDYENHLSILKVSNSKWHTIGSRTGDGTLQIAGLSAGDYTARVMSIGSPGTVSDSVAFSVSGDALNGGVNANWGRWIYASICKHFNTHRGDYTMFVEGEEKDIRGNSSYFELRVDGPYYTQSMHGFWDCRIEINTVFTFANKDNVFYAREFADKLASIFTTISCYRYGNGIYDDDTLLGCLQPIEGYREKLQISQFGVMPNAEVQQGSIERHYKMELAEE